ncbi:MAG TPA: hypothetical protein VG722_10125, partial [Tepidisphaeraceae bacterium]|nr:hypothetical protein [Tepidisphaeraceae bacterium]
MIELLESRTLLSTVPPTAAGSYTGTFSPKGRTAQNAFGGAHVAITMTLAVASSGLISGSLSFTNIASDTVTGSSIGTRVNLTLIS